MLLMQQRCTRSLNLSGGRTVGLDEQLLLKCRLFLLLQLKTTGGFSVVDTSQNEGFLGE